MLMFNFCFCNGTSLGIVLRTLLVGMLVWPWLLKRLEGLLLGNKCFLWWSGCAYNFNILWGFRKYPCPTHGMSVEIPIGLWGSYKAEILKDKLLTKVKMEFSRVWEWVAQTRKTSVGTKDVFCNNTIMFC